MAFDDPSRIVPGDGVVHLVYDVKPADTETRSKEKD